MRGTRMAAPAMRSSHVIAGLAALGLACLALVALSGHGLRVELAGKTACSDVYDSWRGFDTNNPECLHGYLADNVQPTADCLRDPIMCAANHLQASEETGNSWRLTKAFPKGLRKRGEDMFPYSVQGPTQGAEGQYPTAFASKGAKQQMLAEVEDSMPEVASKQAHRGRNVIKAAPSKANKAPVWTVHTDPVTGRSYRYEATTGQSKWISKPLEHGNFPQLPSSLKGITKAPEVTGRYSSQLTESQPVEGPTKVQSIASLANDQPGQSVDITQDMMQALEDCKTQDKGNCEEIMGVLGGHRFQKQVKKQREAAEKATEKELQREAKLKKEGYVFSSPSHAGNSQDEGLVSMSMSGKQLESEEAKNEEQSEGWENSMIYGAHDAKVPAREGGRHVATGDHSNMAAVAGQVAVLQKEAAKRGLTDGQGRVVTHIETGASETVKNRLRQVNKKLRRLARKELDRKHQLDPAREKQYQDAANALAQFA